MLTINSVNSAVSFQGNQDKKQGKLKTAAKKLFERPSAEEMEKRKAESKVRMKACMGELKGLAIGLPLNLLPVCVLSKYNGMLGADEVNVLENAADDYIKNGKLKDIVNIKRVETIKPSAKDLVRSFANPFGTREQIKYGINAAFDNGAGEIIMPKGKLALTSFHEMGHALNLNFSKAGKFLQSIRTPLLLAAMLTSQFALSVALLKDGKETEEQKESASLYQNDNAENAKTDKKVQKEGFKSKLVKFAKKATPVLPMILMAPIVAEEALASFKGNNIAKEAFKEMPKLAKKVKINNAIALTSYISSGLLLSLVSHLAIKGAEKEKARQSEEQAQKA